MEFSILGPLEVRRDGQTLALGGVKQRALLASLLIQANRVIGVERLVELLWGDQPPAGATHVLEVYISQLRKVLEPEGAPYRVLVRRRPGYMLHVAPNDLDSVQFENLVESARQSSPEQATAQLTKALGLSRGPALADFATEPFALSEAARLNELRLHALEERVDAELVLGHHSQLIGELGALVHEHPLRERLCGQLMLALYRSGRQAKASNVYRQTRGRLVEELGMEPGPDLQALLTRILKQDPALAVLAGASTAPKVELPSGTIPTPCGRQ